MLHRSRFVGNTVFCLCTMFTALAASVSAAGPQLINHQGILLDGSGDPVIVATNIEFRIYDAPAGGLLLWSETQLVTPDADGLYNVLLGSVTAIPDAAFAGDAYLALKVGGDAEMPTRQRLVSVPFTYRTRTVDGAAGGTITSKVSIGTGHANIGTSAFVAGENNTVSGYGSAVGGGGSNTATAQYTAVAGGSGNDAVADFAASGGGVANTISGVESYVGGGRANRAFGGNSAVGGGYDNEASALYSTVSGGISNYARQEASTIAGGANNIVNAPWATVPGGYLNQAIGNYSLAAGRRAQANHNGAFVWGDATDADFTSTGANQFLVRASGGVGIGTNSPAAGALAVNMTSVHFGGGSGYDFPMADGAAAQVLSSDGAGQLDWASLPGLSASADELALILISTIPADLDSVTVTFPADGFVFIHCQAILNNATAGNYLVLNVYEDNVQLASGDWDAGDVDGWYDQTQSYAVTRAVTAGTHTYKYSLTTNNGTAIAAYPKISVLFFPVTYGSEASPIAGATPGDAAAQVSGGYLNDTGNPRTGDIAQTSSVVRNDEILRELQALREKVAQLEQRVGEN